MINLQCRNLSEAIQSMALTLNHNGSRIMENGEEWAKLGDPAIVEITDICGYCPRYLALGDPFIHLLSSFPWMFPASSGSRYPDRFDPKLRLPESASPSAIAAQILGNSRQVLQIGDYLVTFEMNGTPDMHGVLNMNIVVSVGSLAQAMIWMTRWSVLFQAVASCMGIMRGSTTMFILHPCEPVSLLESVLKEHDEIGPAGSYGPISLIAGAYEEWLPDAKMFIDEHCMAIGYQDRFISRVLSPAMAAHRHLIDPDASPADRVGRAYTAAGLVLDHEWKSMLQRFVKMQPS